MDYEDFLPLDTASRFGDVLLNTAKVVFETNGFFERSLKVASNFSATLWRNCTWSKRTQARPKRLSMRCWTMKRLSCASWTTCEGGWATSRKKCHRCPQHSLLRLLAGVLLTARTG